MKEFEDALLDISLHTMDYAAKKYSDIDYKAIALITISGVMIGLLSGNDLSKTMNMNNHGLIIFIPIISIFLFLLTIFKCSKIMSPQNYGEVTTHLLIKCFSNENPQCQIHGTIGTIADSADELSKICDEKAKQLIKAMHTLEIGIAIMGVYTIALFLGL